MVAASELSSTGLVVDRQPVIVSRHDDGQIYVLINRCRHRGSVCREEKLGHSKARPPGGADLALAPDETVAEAVHELTGGAGADLVVRKDVWLPGVRGHDHRSAEPAIELIRSGRRPLRVLATHRFPLEGEDEAPRIGGRRTDRGDPREHRAGPAGRLRRTE